MKRGENNQVNSLKTPSIVDEMYEIDSKQLRMPHKCQLYRFTKSLKMVKLDRRQRSLYRNGNVRDRMSPNVVKIYAREAASL